MPLLAIQVSDELHAKVRRKSADVNVSVSDFVRRALTKWVDTPQDKLKVVTVGTKDPDGAYVGWVFDGTGLKNPAPGQTIFPDGSGLVVGYTTDELDKMMAKKRRGTK